jgi:hypothetical protein
VALSLKLEIPRERQRGDFVSFGRAPLFRILFETAQYPCQTVANPYRRYCGEIGERQRSTFPQTRRE